MDSLIQTCNSIFENCLGVFPECKCKFAWRGGKLFFSHRLEKHIFLNISLTVHPTKKMVRTIFIEN